MDIPRLLLAEDEPNQREMLLYVLQDAGYQVECASDGHQALAKIVSGQFHLVLTDWAMPGMSGTALCQHVRAANLPGYVYILLLTAHSSREDVVAGLEAGADDYLTKPADPAELLARLNAGWRIVRLERSLREANERIRLLSVTDGLVGTFNRRYLDEELAKEIERARRYVRPLSVVMADLDHFKRINDRYGHGAGDDVLRQFGLLARSSTRQASDWVARYGGEEFAIVLPDTARGGAVSTAEKIRMTLESTPITTAGGELDVTASFGVASLDPLLPSHDAIASSLLQHADEALYRSKLAGRNRVTVYEADE